MAKKKHKAKKHSEYRPDEAGGNEEASSKEPEKEQTPQVQEESLRDSRISILAFILAGIGMGFLSLTLSPMLGNYMTAFAAVAFAFVTGKLVGSVLGRKDMKWLLGNGMAIYFFIWLISWIFFFNLLGGAG